MEEPPPGAKRVHRKEVAVVVPVYRLPLSEEEEISLRHLRHFLERFDIKVIAPRQLTIDHPYLQTLETLRFPTKYFAGVRGYNRLMLSRNFYSQFLRYEYILIYQLDCLVFSDRLLQWCLKGWDYVGAPWFHNHQSDPTRGLWATGNGGLSLRRVDKFLEVLNSRKRLLDEPPLDTRFFPDSPKLQRLLRPTKALAYACGYKNTVQHFVRQYQMHEDIFWAFEARRFVTSFAVPPPIEALAFAFELAPRYCYQANDERLPFGCHAWAKTDKEFWRRFVLQPGIREADATSLRDR
jgi:hypothetical protein